MLLTWKGKRALVFALTCRANKWSFMGCLIEGRFFFSSTLWRQCHPSIQVWSSHSLTRFFFLFYFLEIMPLIQSEYPTSCASLAFQSIYTQQAFKIDEHYFSFRENMQKHRMVYETIIQTCTIPTLISTSNILKNFIQLHKCKLNKRRKKKFQTQG